MRIIITYSTHAAAILRV